MYLHLISGTEPQTWAYVDFKNVAVFASPFKKNIPSAMEQYFISIGISINFY